MGKTGSKFVIGLGFALVMLALFVNAWKIGNVRSADSAFDREKCELKDLGTEPLAPRLGEVTLPTDEKIAKNLGITGDDNINIKAFKDNCKDALTAARKKVEENDAIKKWNEQVDKSRKGDWQSTKDYIGALGKYYSTTYFEFAKKGVSYAEDAQAIENNQAWRNAKRFDYAWLLSMIMFLGVLFVAAGGVGLTMTGENYEKVGALILLTGVLFFICNYWGGISIK